VKKTIRRTNVLASNHQLIYATIANGKAESHIPNIGIKEHKNTIIAIVIIYGNPP
jgi:hypothetical protein